MPAYLVLKECAYVDADGAAVHHREVEGGLVAEIPEDVAAELGDAVRPMVSGPLPDTLAATPFPDATVELGKATRDRRAKSDAEDTDG
jgi:hypothetical protein